MTSSSVPLVACCVATASAGAVHGIQPADINRNGDPCTDFFDYANGAWRKENPIPSYMGRWSRRWQAGEVNKEHVRDILDELSAKTDWPKGSAGQLAGDFYATCMDESRARRARQQADPTLARRHRSIKAKAGLQASDGGLHDVAWRCRSSSMPPRRARTSGPSRKSTPVAWGCPTATITSRQNPRFVEARAEYLAHRGEDVRLTGTSPAAKAHADSVFASRRAWRKPRSTTAVARSDDAGSPDPFADLSKIAPNFDWAQYSTRPACRAMPSTQPAEIPAAVDKALATRRSRMEGLPAVAGPACRRGLAVQPFVEGISPSMASSSRVPRK